MNIEKFITARKAANLSQKEVSEGICTQATLSKFENNGQVPSLKILIKLCNRINLPLVELFSSMNVINTQLDEQLEKAEFSLITSEYEQLTQILAAIDPKVIDESELIARYYYLKGFEMIFTNAPITDVLFHFDQLLMAETANTLFRLLAYTGIGMVYAREKELEKAEVYFNRVFEKIYEGKKEDCYLMEYRYDDNATNVKAMKYLIEHYFDNFKVDSIEIIGSGYDSVAYLVNNEYIFKTKFSTNKKKGYAKEKAIYNFLNTNLETNVKIPNIEYSYISDELSILGYKEIKGTFLTPEIYSTMSEEEQNLLKRDIASFLRQMHGLDYTDISECTIDNKQNVLEEYILLRETIYNDLTDIEKDYIESFMERLNATTVFEGKKCLCHNDFSCNHLLLDGNNRLTGIIDFGDSGIIDEYCDFIYLLEDSEEEIGTNFGEDILRMYGNIDIEKAKEYQDIVEEYYPIETIVYGIKNIKQEFIENGRKEIYKRTYKD